MSRSPEALTIIEPISWGTRMKIENEPGKGAILVAEHAQDGNAFNIYWPAKPDPEAVKKIIDEKNGGEVQWTKDTNNDIHAELKIGRFWFSPMSDGYAPRAGMQIEVTDPQDIDVFIENVTQIAPKTCPDSVTMPSDLKEQLTKFAASTQSKK